MASLLELFSRKKVCTLLANVDGAVVEKFAHFKNFLDHNRESLTLIAELEQLYYGGQPVNQAAVKEKFAALVQAVRNLVEALNGLAAGQYAALEPVVARLAAAADLLWRPPALPPDLPLVLPLDALTPDMVPVAGGKATNLATVKNVLAAPAPPGFVVTARGAALFFEENRLEDFIEDRLAQISLDDAAALTASGAALQDRVRQAPVPAALAAEIFRAYDALTAAGAPVRLAMRSSAVGEDTEASFAGQYTTVLNVRREGLLAAYKEVLASKYNPWAIAYRQRYGLSDRDTPMCVAGIVMVDAAASGVLYTVDPARPDSGRLKITALFGLGEQLVSGQATPDAFWVERASGRLGDRQISRKPWRLVTLPEGGTRLEEVPAGQDLPALDDATVRDLASWGRKFEAHFGSPQDVEWAVDAQGRLWFLQSRPLGLTPARRDAREQTHPDFSGYPVVLRGGITASRGAAVGRVYLPEGGGPPDVPPDAILVTRRATPDYAVLLGRVRGLIAEVGSAASHLASVAREFQVPALFDAAGAATALSPDQEITLVADTATVYQGHIPEVAAAGKNPRKFIMDSPVHRKLRALLDLTAPLNLTDPQDPSFAPEGCQTLHDVIRFAHETSMREMFALSAQPDRGLLTARLQSNIPLSLHLIDLGEGLKFGLTTCDDITPDHIESVPMKALWRGFTHPGVTWKGAIAFDLRNFMTLMAQGAMRDEGDQPGTDSYALLSREYLNLSAKFGYHFANLDALVTDVPDQNYASLQFSGGVGSVYGRSLRLSFLAAVLSRLGYQVTVTGDLLEASLTGVAAAALEDVLDHTGRLLAASRLLDMAISDELAVEDMTRAFFRGDYNFLERDQSGRLPGFYTHVGAWERHLAPDGVIFRQDGSSYRSTLASGLTSLMVTVMGRKYYEFLDNIEAYFYFPLAIAKDSSVAAGRVSVRIRPVGGKIDQAGGLAFGIRNLGNYFVLRVNALEDNLVLFEFVNNRRFLRAAVPCRVETGAWQHIAVDLAGHTVTGCLDGDPLIDYEAARPVAGFVGLWTKADSVSEFSALTVDTGAGSRCFWD